MRSDQEKDYLLRAVDALKRDVVIISPDFRIMAANRHAAAKWEGPLVGQLCHRLFYSQEAPCEDCPAVKAMQTGATVIMNDRIELLAPTKWATCFPIFSDNRIDALVLVDYDISRISSLEEKLERSNAFLRNILRSAVDGIIAADMTGKVIIFNQAAAEVTGYSVADALDSLYIWQIYPGEGPHDAREIMRQLRGTDYGGRGKLTRYLTEIVGKNKERIPISLYATIIYEEGREIATIGFFHDQRERTRMKAELARAQVQLLQAEKMASLGKLAAGVAHQLNNPLGGITLYSQLMIEEHDLSAEAKADIRRIMQDAERCRDTVRELLEFARQTRQQMQPQDINRILARTLFLLENQTLFHNIAIVRDFGESLPPVQADIQQLNHMFMNLILNAAQAMQGSGRLDLKTAVDADAHHVRIEICDTGPGIDPEILPHIFEPFFTTKDAGEGTGLGLSMAYSIAQSHGGKIQVDSRPDRGTTFVVTLPVTGPADRGAQCE